MPNPNNYDNKDDFIKACIPIVIKEGTAKDGAQASAICNSMWKRKNMKTKTVDGFTSPTFTDDLPQKGQDILASTYANCRAQWTKDHPDDKENQGNKEKCAKIAWSAVSKAGFKREDNDDYYKKEMKLETVNIGDVEIFEAGKWKGEEYTEEDLDAFIENFNNKIAEPYITIDHNDKATAQFKDALKALSLGFVSGLRKAGKKLIADFKQVPKTIADLVEAGALKKRSIEFYRDFIANGKKYKNVLQGVTFHGANGLPEVNTLSDFLTLYKSNLQVMDNKDGIVSLNNSDKEKHNKKEDFRMDEITLKQSDYNELLKLKSQFVTLQQENEEIKKEVEETKEEVAEVKKENEEVKKENAELKEAAEQVEKEKEEQLKKEADDYVTAKVQEGYIKPASKERYVNEYLTYKKDEKMFKDWKEDIDGRGKIINVGNVEYPENMSVTDFKYDPEQVNYKAGSEINYEEIDKRINAYMKSKSVSYEDAMIACNFSSKDELGIKEEA